MEWDNHLLKYYEGAVFRPDLGPHHKVLTAFIPFIVTYYKTINFSWAENLCPESKFCLYLQLLQQILLRFINIYVEPKLSRTGLKTYTLNEANRGFEI